MSKSTISTFQLFALFPDEATAREYLEARLYVPEHPDNPTLVGNRLFACLGEFA